MLFLIFFKQPKNKLFLFVIWWILFLILLFLKFNKHVLNIKILLNNKETCFPQLRNTKKFFWLLH